MRRRRTSEREHSICSVRCPAISPSGTQHVLRLRAIPDFDKLIDAILVYCRSPYRVVAPGCHRPVGSDQEAETIRKASPI